MPYPEIKTPPDGAPPPPYSVSHDSTNTCDPNRVERLRRFLSFCLSIDYETADWTPDRLSREDCFHYVELSRYCFDLFCKTQKAIRRPMLKWPESLRDPYIEREICEPAKALGIEVSRVTVMLRTFTQSINSWGTYHSTVRTYVLSDIVTLWSAATLAAKVAEDRDHLIALLLPKDDSLKAQKLRETVLNRNRWVGRRYYLKLNSKADWTAGWRRVAWHWKIVFFPFLLKNISMWMARHHYDCVHELVCRLQASEEDMEAMGPHEKRKCLEARANASKLFEEDD